MELPLTTQELGHTFSLPLLVQPGLVNTLPPLLGPEEEERARICSGSVLALASCSESSVDYATELGAVTAVELSVVQETERVSRAASIPRRQVVEQGLVEQQVFEEVGSAVLQALEMDAVEASVLKEQETLALGVYRLRRDEI